MAFLSKISCIFVYNLIKYDRKGGSFQKLRLKIKEKDQNKGQFRNFLEIKKRSS